jgi:4-amino-4-deoxy-L-arabinose transferase-like glycosyltransferase
MEKTVSVDEKERGKTKHLLFPLITLAVLSLALFLCLYLHGSWLAVFGQLGTWLINPVIHYTPMQVGGVANALFATIEIVVLGTLVSHLLLAREEDKFLKRICAIGLGFGFTGFITILLAEFEVLYAVPLNVVILLSVIGFILGGCFYKKRKCDVQSVQSFLRASFSLWRLRKPAGVKNYLAVALPIGLVLFLSFYQALFAPVVNADATVYHAVMPSITYRYHALPLIAGQSLGLEMSSNYPPMYSALCGYYYIQVGGVEDFYLKALSPVMALLIVLVVFKIGKLIGGVTYGKISAFLLSATSLFILYSIFATCYMTYVFFVAASLLFMLLALTKGRSEYWVICGVFYGFSLLSHYQALLLAPVFLAVFFYLLLRRESRWTSLKYSVPVLAISGVWYLRNFILLGNPVFPLFYELFGGRYVDPVIRAKIFQSLYEGGMTSYFNSVTPSVVERVGAFVFNFQQFPALSLLTFVGVFWALYRILYKKEIRKELVVLLFWAFVPSLLLLSGVEWAFPRAFLVTIPPFAVLSAIPISEAFNRLRRNKSFCGSWLASFRRFWIKNLISVFLSAVLLMCFLFPGLTIALTGKATSDGPSVDPPGDALFYIKNPGVRVGGWYDDGWYHGVNITIWQFLNNHVKEGEKIATFENKLYYIKGGDPEYFFMLDGWNATPLYQITDPAEMVQFLRENNVTYLYASWKTHGPLWLDMPLTSHLPSQWFPIVYRPDPKAIEDYPHSGIIYNVGPIPEQ